MMALWHSIVGISHSTQPVDGGVDDGGVRTAVDTGQPSADVGCVRRCVERVYDLSGSWASLGPNEGMQNDVKVAAEAPCDERLPEPVHNPSTTRPWRTASGLTCR